MNLILEMKVYKPIILLQIVEMEATELQKQPLKNLKRVVRRMNQIWEKMRGQ